MTLDNEIRSIGVIGAGSRVGEKICDAVAEIPGIEEVHLCDFECMEEKMDAYAEGLDNESDGRISIATYPFFGPSSISYVYKESDLVFIACSHVFGARGIQERDYLDIEKEKLGASGQESDEFKLASKIYKLMQNLSLDKEAEYRILNELPYNFDIVKTLGTLFRPYKDSGKKVVVYSNAIDLLTYVFALYSGMVNGLAGGNHFDDYRTKRIVERGILKKLRGILPIKQGSRAYALADHGGGATPILSDILIEHDEMSLPELVSIAKKLDIKEGDALYDFIQGDTRKYAQKLRKILGPEGPLRDVRPVSKRIINGLMHGGELELSVYMTLAEIATSMHRNVRNSEKFKKFMEKDRGLFNGWIVDMFKKKRFNLTQWESQRIFESYMKLYDVLEALRNANLLEGSAFDDGYVSAPVPEIEMAADADDESDFIRHLEASVDEDKVFALSIEKGVKRFKSKKKKPKSGG